MKMLLGGNGGCAFVSLLFGNDWELDLLQNPVPKLGLERATLIIRGGHCESVNELPSCTGISGQPSLSELSATAKLCREWI